MHINNGKVKGDWKKSGPTIPDLDRALQSYSYDIVELQGDSVAGSLVGWAECEGIDFLVVGSGKSGPGRRLPNPIQNRTTDFIAAHATCATLVIHPKVRSAIVLGALGALVDESLQTGTVASNTLAASSISLVFHLDQRTSELLINCMSNMSVAHVIRTLMQTYPAPRSCKLMQTRMPVTRYEIPGLSHMSLSITSTCAVFTGNELHSVSLEWSSR